MDNFNLKKFMVENRLTTLSRLLSENQEYLATDENGINWKYPETENDYYYEPEPEDGGYTVHLPIIGVAPDGSEVPGMLRLAVDDLEDINNLDTIDPANIDTDLDPDDREDILNTYGSGNT